VADRLKTVFDTISKPPKVFILRMRNVPFVDATGLQALVDFYNRCKRDGTVLILSGVGHGLSKDLENYGYYELIGREHVCDHIDTALRKARVYL